MERGTVTRGPERPRAESRSTLQKLGAAFPPRARRAACGLWGLLSGRAEPAAHRTNRVELRKTVASFAPTGFTLRGSALGATRPGLARSGRRRAY